MQLVGKLKLFILHLNRSLHRGNLSERSSTKVQIISELILAAASSHYLNYCQLQHLNLTAPVCCIASWVDRFKSRALSYPPGYEAINVGRASYNS